MSAIFREWIGAQPGCAGSAGGAAACERRKPAARAEHRLHHHQLCGREAELGAAPVGTAPHATADFPAAASELPPGHSLPPQHGRCRGAARGLRLK